MAKLNVKRVAAWTGPGLLSDGGNLYLVARKPTQKSWVFIYRSRETGTQRYLGLGSAGQYGVTLAEARERAAAARSLLRKGIDPLEERQREKASAKAARVKIPTFGAIADEYIRQHRSSWRNAKHAEQWVNTLTKTAAPLRELPVNEITTEDVLGVLKPLWLTIPETAQRLRGRIEIVLDAAKVLGHRPTGGEVARWKGHLDKLLPKRQKLTRGHHRALPFQQMAEFMVKLRTKNTTCARLLEFAILTAARAGEARGATWQEVDLVSGIWTIPASRMKAGKEHKVPLSPRALDIVQAMLPLKRNESSVIFPAPRGSSYSDAAMGLLIEELGYKDTATSHGFRSSFRDWCGEVTSFPSDIAEMALAHVVANRVEAAYRRGSMLERRRGLMTCWEMHCDGISLEMANSAVTALLNGLSTVFPHGIASNVVKFRSVAA